MKTIRELLADVEEDIKRLEDLRDMTSTSSYLKKELWSGSLARRNLWETMARRKGILDATASFRAMLKNCNKKRLTPMSELCINIKDLEVQLPEVKE